MNSVIRKAAIVAAGASAALLAGQAYLRRGRWFDFVDKRVVVAGGSRGLGLVLARRLVKLGARVAICSRDAEQLTTAASELRYAGGTVLAQLCDISDEAQVEKFIAGVTDQWGGVDVLINVAGIMDVGPFDAMTTDDFRRSMDINCWGHLNMMQAVLPEMRRRRWGRIVNVASLGGKRAVPHMLPYAASKFALVGLSTGLRTELAPEGVLVTTVCPGLMRTGSPRNATFKGKHRDEYAWFSIGDSLPLVSISAESAARKILKACQRGDAEVAVVGPGNFSQTLFTLAPNLAAELLTVMNRLLPAMGGIGRESVKGHESESAWSPSPLTTLTDRAARRNNEMLQERRPVRPK